MRSWSIRTRLVLALIGVLTPFLALDGIGVVGVRAIWWNVKNINDEAVRVVKETADLQVALLELSKPVKLYLMIGDPAERAQFEERFARVQEVLARMETPLFKHVDERRLLEAVRGQVPRLEALSREILGVPDPRTDRTAPERMIALVKLSDRATGALGELHETGLRKVESEFARVLDTIWRAMAYGLGILILSTAGGVAMALVFSSWLSWPLLAITQGSRRMAAGDLSQRVEVRAGGELGQTAQAFNEMAERLEASTRELAGTVEELRALRDVSQAVSSSLDLPHVLDTIMGHAVNLSKTDACAIFEFDVSGRAFAGGASRNLSREFLDAIRTTRADPTKAAVWRAAESGQPFQIADVAVAADYPFREITLKEGFRALLAVPMGGAAMARGIVLFRRAPGVFDDQVVSLLTALANQSKVAIENARLFQEVERQRIQLENLSKNLEQLYRLSTAIQEPLSLKEQLTRVLEAAREVVSIDRFYIWAVTPEGDKLAALAGAGFSGEELKEVLGAEIPLVEAGAMSKAYREGTPLVFNEQNPLPAELRLKPPYSGLKAVRTRSFLVVPMIARGRTVGLLTADNKWSGQPILPHTVELLQTFASHAAVAVENARLFQELEARTRELARSVEELKALGEVSQAVSSTLDLQTVLTTIVARAVQLSGTNGGVIYEYDEGTQAFHLRATHRVEEELVEAIRAASIRPGEGAAGQAAASRAPVQVTDVLDEREYTVTRIRLILARLGYRSILAVPLLFEQRIMGALVVHRRESGRFSPEVVNLLQTFAAQSTLAIQNARLFREIEDKSRQLELASRHKSQFLANMSHELRTPLNAILGYTELTLDNVYGEVPEKIRDVMTRVAKSGRHLLGLINDVLDLSKIEAGQLTLALTDCSLKDIVQTVVTAMEALAAEKKLALRVSVSPDLPTGRGDERRITQVLLNLVGNAIKFTQAGEVRLRATASAGAFVVSVADTGPGIAPADQQKIFEEFQQADSARTQKTGGTGLGLAIAKRIIEMHGGRMWVESTPGQGSTFWFTLPVRVERQTEAV
jgi:signal transduction histidine kinase